MSLSMVLVVFLLSGPTPCHVPVGASDIFTFVYGQFAGFIAHESRVLLGSIMGYMEPWDLGNFWRIGYRKDRRCPSELRRAWRTMHFQSFNRRCAIGDLFIFRKRFANKHADSNFYVSFRQNQEKI